MSDPYVLLYTREKGFGSALKAGVDFQKKGRSKMLVRGRDVVWATHTPLSRSALSRWRRLVALSVSRGPLIPSSRERDLLVCILLERGSSG